MSRLCTCFSCPPVLSVLVLWSASLLFPLEAVPAPAILTGTHFQFFERPEQANDLRMGSVEGKTFSLRDLKGKVVLLNFWRKDCQYCAREKGYLKKLLKDLSRPDLEVLCVNLWDSPSSIARQTTGGSPGSLRYATRPDDRRWVVENSVRGRLMGYYVLNEANEAIYEIKGFPSTYVIDKHGRVIAMHLGMVEWTDPSIRNWLVSLLGDRSEPSLAESWDYVLPEWLDGLLTNNMGFSGESAETPRRSALVAPRK